MSSDLPDRLRKLLRFILPYDASLAVVAEGDSSLLDLEGRRAEHFPQTPAGVYSGSYPSSDAELILQVDALHEKGIAFLVFPALTAWWLEHYEGLRSHLARRYRLVHRDMSTAIIFALHNTADANYRRFGAPDGLPLPPPEFIALTTSEYDASRFYESGKHGGGVITDLFLRAGCDLSKTTTILDYGCGCGRVLRQWKTLDADFIAGSDYNPYFVEFLTRTLPFADVRHNAPGEPPPFENGTFDAIYALSVLTHLDPKTQDTCIDDLAQLLRPDGVLLVTVHGESRTARLSDADRDRFLAGELIVHASDLSGSNACATWHPQAYLHEWLGERFESIDLVPDGASDVRQDAVLLQGPRIPRRGK
jgi:SAM-dependent methyltransferase